MDFLAVQGTLKSLLQHHSSKASILWCSAFFIVQLSHPHMTTGKTIALTRWTVGKVMSLLFNVLSMFVIAFLSSIQSLSRVRLFAMPWTIAHQAPLSEEFPRQGYWNGLPFPCLTPYFTLPKQVVSKYSLLIRDSLSF